MGSIKGNKLRKGKIELYSYIRYRARINRYRVKNYKMVD